MLANRARCRCSLTVRLQLRAGSVLIGAGAVPCGPSLVIVAVAKRPKEETTVESHPSKGEGWGTRHTRSLGQSSAIPMRFCRLALFLICCRCCLKIRWALAHCGVHYSTSP